MQGRPESKQAQQIQTSDVATKPIGYSLRWLHYWDNWCNASEPCGSSQPTLVLGEPVPPTQTSQKTIMSALSGAMPDAPKPQDMNRETKHTPNRCAAVNDCIKDSAVIGTGAGAALSSLTLLPVCFAYCAYQKRETEVGKMENDGSCYLACLACLSASPGIAVGDCLGVTLGIFASPFIACVGKEPDCIKTTSRSIINL